MIRRNFLKYKFFFKFLSQRWKRNQKIKPTFFFQLFP